MSRKPLLEDIRGALRSECCVGIDPKVVARLLTHVEQAIFEMNQLRRLMDNLDPSMPKWEDRTDSNRASILTNYFSNITKTWEQLNGL